MLLVAVCDHLVDVFSLFVEFNLVKFQYPTLLLQILVLVAQLVIEFGDGFQSLLYISPFFLVLFVEIG